MVRPGLQDPTCLSRVEVVVRAGHEVLEDVDDNRALIVGNL
jgi:hypothetical protein